jgi:site-specific DNA recombinase
MSEDLYAAFLRCSEEELQNPELSLDRQLHNCQPAVAKRGGRIVANYYEIETGTSRYDQRGRGTNLAGYHIPIPRAGGLHELVADANRSPGRSTSRSARTSTVSPATPPSPSP